MQIGCSSLRRGIPLQTRGNAQTGAEAYAVCVSTNTTAPEVTAETDVAAGESPTAFAELETPQQRADRLSRIGTGPVWVITAIVLDAVSILLFAFIGGRAHAADPSFLHVLEVAWPFLLSAFVGWVWAHAWRRPLDLSHTAAPIWLFTLVGGVLLRGLTLHGVAFGFVIVTGTVLAVFMFGWRAILRSFARRSAGWRR
ncbi:DUF3054 domain-containing protein [Pseudoclavibacter sp. CFCC 11306]|nr:DUF3054 domain-containing protein [Pseudoclavibacter sp. CFCC 11306]